MNNLNPLASVRQIYESFDTRKQRRYRAIGATSAAVLGTAVVGSLATDTSSSWYRALNKPSIQPPAWVFPFAWTGLYTSIAAVVGRDLADLQERGETAEYQALRKALVSNLVLNAGWSALFFKGKQSGPAAIEAGVLAASSADLARRSMAVNRRRGAFLLPYVAWTSFATVLTGTIWYQNR